RVDHAGRRGVRSSPEHDLSLAAGPILSQFCCRGEPNDEKLRKFSQTFLFVLTPRWECVAVLRQLMSQPSGRYSIGAEIRPFPGRRVSHCCITECCNACFICV